MSRNRTPLTGAQEKKLRDMMAMGASVEKTTAALRATGAKVSPATVNRRMREEKGKAPKKRAPRASARPPAPTTEPEEIEVPETEADIPQGASPDVYKRLLKAAETKASAADGIDDWSKCARIIVAIQDAQRKAAPPPKADPSENPDWVAAAKSARAKLFQLIEKAPGRD